jgi:hypothetical protein
MLAALAGDAPSIIGAMAEDHAKAAFARAEAALEFDDDIANLCRTARLFPAN